MSVQPSDPTGQSQPAVEDLDPQEAVAESQALSEREDGTIKGGKGPGSGSGEGRSFAAAGADPREGQPISPDSERNALSEREDGTNRGS